MSDAHGAGETKSSGGGSSSPLMFIVKLLAFILVIVIMLLFIVRDPSTAASFVTFLHIIQVLSIVVIIGAVIFTLKQMYAFEPISHELTKGYSQKYKAPAAKVEINSYTHRLDRVSAHLETENMSEWKLAIMELDGILRDVLRDNGYLGETIAEQLKAAEDRRFATLDNAWEAHKVRNRIAHDGIAFTMDKHEVKRIFSLYKSVFEEFKII